MLILFKSLRMSMIIICIFFVGAVSIQAEEKKSETAVPSMQSMTPAMQKSMDPQVWSNMMAMMMNPEKMMSMESCAQCHDGEDVARYQKDFGPMMEAMKPMMRMMNPHMMTSMMNPNAYMNMMNPAMYMNMMGPMMGMMGPMMGMSAPMMGSMMNPMSMMNPAMYMNMMYPMMGMMGPMMGPMAGGMHGSNPMAQMPGGQMMDPKQYEQWFSQWTEMMKNFTPQTQPKQ